MALVIVIIVVAVVVLASGGLVVATRARRRGAQPPAPPGVALGPRPQRRPLAVPASTEVVTLGEPAAAPQRVPPAEQAPSRPALKDRLGRARGLLSSYLEHVRGRNAVDDTTFEELEEALILADVGVTPRRGSSASSADSCAVAHLPASDPRALLQALQADLVAIFEGDDGRSSRARAPGRPCGCSSG